MNTPAMRLPPSRRVEYFRFCPITPRWNDNDVFGHTNNAEYYAFFDTAVMRFMIGEKVISITGGALGTIVAETGCRIHREITFHESISVGLRVATLGNSSVRYEIAIFTNDDESAAADGHFVHVFVERATLRPTRIPETARAVLATLVPAEQR